MQLRPDRNRLRGHREAQQLMLLGQGQRHSCGKLRGELFGPPGQILDQYMPYRVYIFKEINDPERVLFFWRRIPAYEISDHFPRLRIFNVCHLRCIRQIIRMF